MRRWRLILLITLVVGGLAAAYFVPPYLKGREKTREILISTPNLVEGFAKPYSPMLISSQNDSEELFRRAKSAVMEGGIYDPVRDAAGLVKFERSLNFDFSRECLILIPVEHGYDSKISLGSLHLASRKLTCQVVVHPPPWSQGVLHPSIQTDLLGVAFQRESIDVVEVWIRGQLSTTFQVQ